MTMYFVNLVLQFFSRKIFLDYLGTEILGLNTTATNLLQFLNLAELGVWGAVATTLYKPLADKNHKDICRIITFNGIIYKRIATLIILASLVLMCFFPLIFKKMELPLWYAYASFGILLFGSLLSYFVNYRQFLLTADQKNYKVQYTYKLSMAIKLIFQIIAVKYFQDPYIWWLLLEMLFAIAGSIVLNRIILKTYPFLVDTKETFKDLSKDYPEIIINIKRLFVQKISSYVLFQTSPLIIYGLSNLYLVTLYGNYMLIINGLISLMAAMFDGMLASIGNLVASTSKEYSIEIFKQLYSLRFMVIAVISYCTLIFGQQFIELWLGVNYLLGKSTLAILVATFAVYVNRYVIYDYLSAYGYFGDVWASVAEVVLNIGLSVVLGIRYGLNGVLTGVLISLIIISMLWKPFFLFKIKLKTKFTNYIKFASFHILSGGALFAGAYMLNTLFRHMNLPSIVAGILSSSIYAATFGLLLYKNCIPFRNAVRRFKR
ncbi:lipopolysaccharide biosynthesis protein [Bacteroides acidifaciens]|uniref:lipopolysaccharide biosynthesis protein n=1 Tax=Bacteroides acidifaciens TaxID=85831 RepID=UPI0026E0C6BE|nr:sugar transporter [Bacteroides acidifaciens]